MSKHQSITSAANAMTLPEDTGRQMPGIVCAANESRFTQSTFSEPLTAYSVGWKDPNNLQQVLDSITGTPITVGRRFEFKKADNAQAFLTEAEDERAIGAAFKRVEYTGATVNAKLGNHGLTIRIDKDEIEPSDTMWQERFVALLKDRLLRNKIIRAVKGLLDASHDNAVNWTFNADTNPNPNPDADLRTTLSTASEKSGIRPNRILIGAAGWDARASAYETQNTAGAFAAADKTPEQLAAKLMVEKVIPVHSRYTSGAARVEMVGANAICYTAFDGVSKDDASNIKRFIGNGGTRVYVDEKDKYVDITVEDYDLIVVTSTLGLEKDTIS